MEINVDFNLIRSQKLLFSPHLKQAMDILEMDSQQLSAYVEEQAAANPALEISYGGVFDGMENFLDEEETPAGMSLKDYLLLQLESVLNEKQDQSVGEYLIDHTDENGYMKIETDEAAAELNLPADRIEKVLAVLQSLEPPGICARNLRECLLIQLKQHKGVEQAVLDIVEKHLDELASGDSAEVAAETGLSEERVREVFELIRSMEPRPGREFYPDCGARRMTADILIRNIDHEYVALINEEAMPVVEIGDCFEGFEPSSISPDESNYIQNRLNKAGWLIKCMEQRRCIIYSVAEMIAQEEQEFFSEGPGKLKRIKTRLIAEKLELHDSLVRSALKGKYLQCRWGIFELLGFCN